MQKEVTITYTGKALSLNKLYSQGHWGTRVSIKNKYRDIFLSKMKEAAMPFFSTYKVSVVYNNKMDVDNISAMVKIFVDSMKGLYTPEDGTKYFNSMTITYDEKLKKDTFIFTVSDVL